MVACQLCKRDQLGPIFKSEKRDVFVFAFFSMNLKKKENLYQGSLVLSSIHTKQNKLENKAKENEYIYFQWSLSIL